MKKIILKTATTVAGLLLAQQAGAVGVTFNFRVNSSGPSIYPCNAGLLTPSQNPKVCFIAGTTTRCTPTCIGEDCLPGQNPPRSLVHGLFSGGGSQPQPPPAPPAENSCVCNTTQGSSYANYFDASYRDWDQTTTSSNQTVSGQDTFNKLFSESTAYGKTLDKLTINLGSELYNAQYFVDMCYRGPQIDYRDVETKWDLYGKIGVSDFGYQNGSNGYRSLSSLQAKAYVICDLQRDDCPTCNDANPVTDPEAAIFAEGTNFLTTSGAGSARFDYSYQGTTVTSLSSSLTEIFNIPNAFANLGHSAPRFCKIRYVFSETNGTNAATALLRKWQKHGAQVCTYSQVEASGVTTDPSLH